MKKKHLILSVLLTGVIFLTLGIYIGGRYASNNGILSLIDMMAMTDSFELSKSAIYYESLNNGKTQEVINVLYVSIKNELESKDEYIDWELSDNTLKSIAENRQKAKDILEKYPKPKFPDCD